MYIVDLGNRSGDDMSELTADDPVAMDALAGGTGSGDSGNGDRADDAAVAAVREFNRFYTNVIGLLRGKYLETPYSLTEARILFELARCDQAGGEATEVTDLRQVVDIDAGYLSRILARFEADGVVMKERS